MPTYEYACPKCGRHFDLFQSMRDDPIKRCPKCGKLGVKRLVGGGAGLIFKGTGFYITDYKKKSGTPDAGEAKSTGSKVDSAGAKADGGAKGASSTGSGEGKKAAAKSGD